MWRVLLLNKLYAPCREGGCSGFPLIFIPIGPLSQLSEVADLAGCLVLIVFPSFFGVLVWVEAPIESLLTGEGAAATDEAEWKPPVFVDEEGGTETSVFLPACCVFFWGKLALSRVLALNAASAFGFAREEMLLKGFFSARVPE